MKAIGIILIVIGLVGLIWGGIRWTDRDTLVDLGGLQVQSEDHEGFPISPVAGGICLAAGVALLVAGSRRRLA